MAVNGKQKGNRFEREVSNTLSKRFEQFSGIPNSFYRNANSGSFFGGTNKQRKETHNTEFAVYGDITCPKSFNYVIECKNYKDPPSLSSILNQDVKQWDDWLLQARQDSTESGKKLLLIIKYNRIEPFCILDTDSFNSSMSYKGHMIITLDEFLSKDDIFYFTA